MVIKAVLTNSALCVECEKGQKVDGLDLLWVDQKIDQKIWVDQKIDLKNRPFWVDQKIDQ